MNVFVETNFVLELAFQQEQSSSCLKVLDLCKNSKINLFIPSFCLAEPLEKLHRQSLKRRQLQKNLNQEVSQLKRNPDYDLQLKSIRELSNILVQSNYEERTVFENYRKSLLNHSNIIPLSKQILLDACGFEKHPYNLRSQDAIVYSSIVSELKNDFSSKSCFLNRNSKDFQLPEIVSGLHQLNCRMIPRFDDGYDFIDSKI